MTTPPLYERSSRSAPLLIWVFAPYVASTDSNLEYYNDYSQSRAEYQRVFMELGLEWRWEVITMMNF